MAGPRRALGLAFLLVAAAPASAQEDPIQFLKRLIAPPAEAISEAFRPTKVPDPISASPAPTAATVPLPEVRPDHATAPEVAATKPAEGASSDMSVPLLGYAPAEPTSPFDALIPTPRQRPALSALAPLPPLIEPPPAAKSTCGAALAMAGVIAEAMQPIVEGGGCGVAVPVAVSSFEDGDVTLTETAVVECHLAEKLAGWLADTVQPAATATLGGRVTGLRVAASYYCRNRNNQTDTKLSEHAKGNAIDISAFRVKGQWIEVGQASGDDQRFLSAIRKSACGPFATVLGPGADAYHSDHFHLDQARRRAAGPSKGLYCR